MIFYFSCRPLRYRREIISPKECLKNNFTGITFTFDTIGYNPKIDGRWLYEIRLCEDYTEEEADEFKEVIIEGLAAFSAHIKTLQGAKTLADKITGLCFMVNGECIEAPGE